MVRSPSGVHELAESAPPLAAETIKLFRFAFVYDLHLEVSIVVIAPDRLRFSLETGLHTLKGTRHAFTYEPVEQVAVPKRTITGLRSPGCSSRVS